MKRRLYDKEQEQNKKKIAFDNLYIEKCIKTDAILAEIDLSVHMYVNQFRAVLGAPLMIAKEAGGVAEDEGTFASEFIKRKGSAELLKMLQLLWWIY